MDNLFNEIQFYAEDEMIQKTAEAIEDYRATYSEDFSKIKSAITSASKALKTCRVPELLKTIERTESMLNSLGKLIERRLSTGEVYDPQDFDTINYIIRSEGTTIFNAPVTTNPNLGGTRYVQDKKQVRIDPSQIVKLADSIKGEVKKQNFRYANELWEKHYQDFLKQLEKGTKKGSKMIKENGFNYGNAFEGYVDHMYHHEKTEFNVFKEALSYSARKDNMVEVGNKLQAIGQKYKAQTEWSEDPKTTWEHYFVGKIGNLAGIMFGDVGPYQAKNSSSEVKLTSVGLLEEALNQLTLIVEGKANAKKIATNLIKNKYHIAGQAATFPNARLENVIEEKIFKEIKEDWLKATGGLGKYFK